jgi:hypothetical protein
MSHGDAEEITHALVHERGPPAIAQRKTLMKKQTRDVQVDLRKRHQQQ